MPIRPVLPLDEGGVDRRAHRRSTPQRWQQREGPEDQRPHHLNNPTLLPPLAHSRGAQIGREDLLGLGRSARSGTLRLRWFDAVDLPDRRLLRGMLSAGAEPICPPCRPVVNLLDQLLAGVAIALARHQGQQQPALGSHRRVVPVVASEPIPRVERIACRFLLPDEPPLLINWDRAGPGGKERRVPRGAIRHGLRPERGGG